MQYRRLGKSGVKVSEIALGSWLTYGSSVAEENSIKQIHHAFDQGINFFDTANVYARGAAEVVVGKAVSTLKRDDCFIATKVFFPMGDGPNDKGLSRKHVFEQCHASLKRLNIDYIDLYQCHRFDPETPLEELVSTMDNLARQGKILYWGVSEWNAAQIADVCRMAEEMKALAPVSNQPCYNMLTTGIEASVIPTSIKHGLGQVVFSPLAQGVLTGKYIPQGPVPPDSRAADSKNNVFMMGRSLMAYETLEKVQRLCLLAQGAGLTMTQLALAWCLRQSNVSSVIIGATKLDQIDENIRAVGVKLTNDLLDQAHAILTGEVSGVRT